MTGSLRRIGKRAGEVLSGQLLGAGQGFVGDGAGRAVVGVVPSVVAYAGQQTQITVTNSDVSLLSVAGPLTIPGGRVAAGDVLELVAYYSGVQNQGAAQVWTAKVKLGGTALVTSGIGSLGNSASLRRFRTVCRILCTAPNAQRVIQITDPGTAGATTIATSSIDSATAAVDLTTAQTVDLTILSAAAGGTQNLTLDQLTVVHYPFRAA